MRSSAKVQDRRRELPSIDELLRRIEVEPLIADFGRELVVSTLRRRLAELRSKSQPEAADAILSRCRRQIEADLAPSLRRVFNLTGTILHTNLGRACLPEEAIRAASAAFAYPSNLEYDLDEGGRGERDLHVSRLLCRLDRSRSGNRRQQQRGGGAPCDQHAGIAARSRGLAWRIGRDRRILPHSRHHRAGRLPPCRSRHHEPDAHCGFRRGNRAADRTAREECTHRTTSFRGSARHRLTARSPPSQGSTDYH